MIEFLKKLEVKHPRIYDLIMVFILTIISLFVMVTVYACMQLIPELIIRFTKGAS